MQTRSIGSLTVSVVGLGANTFGTEFFSNSRGPEDSARVIHAALDEGINFIDTAEEYSVRTAMGTGHSEEFIGKALGRRRGEVVIATKFMNESLDAPDEHGAARIVSAVEGSLRRLGTDYIDLLQQHRPDPDTPIEETLETLDRLVREGKVREVGCSNFAGEQIAEAEAASASRGLARFVSAQNQYNLIDMPRQEGVLDACEKYRLALLPYWPLASGLLTGKYQQGQDAPEDSRMGGDTKIASSMRKHQLSDQRLSTVSRLEEFAKERNHTLLELAISWLTSQPIVGSVIAGASRPEQVAANARAASWELSTEDFAAVQRIVGSPGGGPKSYA